MHFPSPVRIPIIAALVAAWSLMSACGFRLARNNSSDFVLHSGSRRDELIAKYSSSSSTWQQQYNVAAGEAKKQARNDILNDLMWLADDYYGQLTRNLYNNNAWRQTLFDAAKLGLGAAGTVIGDADLKAVLAATGTGVQGFNSSIDKNFYAQQSVEAIVSAMDSQRAEDKKLLTAGMDKFADQSPAYQLSQGLLDVQKYALDSTLVHALIALSQKASAAAVKSTTELANMQLARYEVNLQNLVRAHQAADQVMRESADFTIDRLQEVPDADVRQHLASQRFALLNVALGQIASLLSEPALPTEERQYFTELEGLFRRERARLASTFDVQ